MTRTREPLIRIRGLRKTHPDGHVALRGIDLDVGEGMTGLLGPNGAGKTTFLSLLVLAREPSGGSRTYGELDAARPGDRGAIRARIGYLPQDFAPIGHLTGREYLGHCARLRRVPLTRSALARRVSDLLHAVDLGSAADRPSHGYSGGMRRRLGVAQALVHLPSIVVVDEPTAGLDPEERIHFRNLISEVAEQTAVLLSTHVVEDIEATCPRLAVIAGGRLLLDGPTGELLTRVAGRLWSLADGGSLPPGAQLIARRAVDRTNRVVVSAASRPAGAEPWPPTLEDAYAAFLTLQHDEQDAA